MSSHAAALAAARTRTAAESTSCSIAAAVSFPGQSLRRGALSVSERGTRASTSSAATSCVTVALSPSNESLSASIPAVSHHDWRSNSLSVAACSKGPRDDELAGGLMNAHALLHSMSSRFMLVQRCGTIDACHAELNKMGLLVASAFHR